MPDGSPDDPISKGNEMHTSKNPQVVNAAYTSDGAPRSNLMTREEFIRRVLHSGEVTQIAQHLAVVIFLLAEGKNQLKVSVRDLERITGWSRTAIGDHLSELRVFMNVTLGIGRAKAIFELQGVIENALAAAVVSGSRATTVATNLVAGHADTTVVASQPDTSQLVASQTATNPEMASQPDTTVVASQVATSGVVASQPAIKSAGAGVTRPVVASQPDTTPVFPPLYKEKESLSLSSSDEQSPVQVNGVAIYGPGFTLEYAAIDLAAGMIGMPKERARAIAEICARDWAANKKKPDYPMAMVKAAIMGDFNKGQVQEVRLEAAKASGKPQPRKLSRW